MVDAERRRQGMKRRSCIPFRKNIVLFSRDPRDWRAGCGGGDHQYRPRERDSVISRCLRLPLTVIFNTEHEVVYTQVSPKRWRGVSRSTRITEVKDAGKPFLNSG